VGIYVTNNSPVQGWEANMKGRFMDFFAGAADSSHINSFLVMQVSGQ
jgi:hypothetical protein